MGSPTLDGGRSRERARAQRAPFPNCAREAASLRARFMPALMIEPTETESRESIEGFVAAMKEIAAEAKVSPEALKAAPTRAFRERLDEVKAARKPILRWKPGLKLEP